MTDVRPSRARHPRTFTMTVDISDFNCPSSTVEAPANFMPMGG